jgi:hypothetical protein
MSILPKGSSSYFAILGTYFGTASEEIIEFQRSNRSKHPAKTSPAKIARSRRLLLGVKTIKAK